MSRSSEYYAVIFTSQHSGEEKEAYALMANRMLELAAEQEGFIGVESARDPSGTGITVSYWETEDSIRAWKANSEHKIAQERGKEMWYEHFSIRVAKVMREYDSK